jgi:hypothetical protein
MRIAVVVALFVVVCAAFLLGVVAPASGETIPPPTATPCAGDCGPLPTPRPDMGTPAPDCIGPCIPFPTPRPTYAPGATIEPAGPNEGMGFWRYVFMPQLGQ